jgi:2-dehydro-3-deoxygluconokinase
LGRRVRAAVAAAGVGVELVELIEGRPTGLMLKDPTPTGTEVLYYRKGSAATGLGLEDVPRLCSVAARFVHLSGVTPALSASCAELVRAIVLDHALGAATVSFDVNFRSRLWTEQDAATTLLALARAADITYVGLDEAHALWGCTSAEQIRAMVPGPSTLVVKDGAVGATAFTAAATVFTAAPAVRVVEPVGAGDSFAAGWLAAELRGLAPEAALRLAHLVAGAALASVSDLGPSPTPAEIAQALSAQVAR